MSATPLPVTVVRARSGLPALDLGEPWRHRHLLYFLIWRDLKVRYRQTALGVLWILVQPALSLAVFTVLFGRLLRVPSGEVPYPVFAYAALLPWSYFAASLTRAAGSLVANARLLTKVYVPRLCLPLASVLAGLVDLAVSLVLLGLLLAAYRVVPGAGIVWLPLFLLLAVINALGFGLWLAALNVRYRDVSYAVPFALQIGMYLTPVVYGVGLVPERYRLLLAWNPMAGVADGLRRSLLGAAAGPGLGPGELALSAAVAVLVLLGGVVFFRFSERTFADVV